MRRLHEALRGQPDPRVFVEQLNKVVAYSEQHSITHPWLTILKDQPETALRMAAESLPELSGSPAGRAYASQIIAWYLYTHRLGPNPAAAKPSDPARVEP